MRRVMFTVAATVLMAGAVSASALAHHHHHSKHHARHHAKIRRFGDQNSAPTSMSASDNAGTVQSFSGGVLTIALNDGSTVKGAVTNDTELECTSTQRSSTTHQDGDSGGGGDQGSGDDQSSGGNDQGDNDQNETQGDNDQNETQGEDQNETQGEDQNENEANNCSSSNLTPGAVVHEASLRIGGSGAVWQKVELVS